MTLFEKLKEVIGLGWEVKFSSFAFQFQITVSHTDTNGNSIEKESWLPLHDHFYEERIVDCIKWSMREISKEIDQRKELNQ